MEESKQDEAGQDTRALVRRLNTAGWGIFLIWIGIASLAGAGWGAGLLGVGAIALGIQAARRYYGLPVERLWLAMGILFAILGVGELFTIEFGGLLPILFILAGIVLVVSALRHKPQHHGG